ncbi:tRNA (5-methylaminomethyl-2-thiouridine)(34)-methyltransferase MnmD [Flavobacterium sediminilitoris]|uniref:tRNA (5-methylaminomethyl-2-thiouridine)(34)-methyltransferase MnmD n=1 Tax=Flavobacterium sediminilitoris TaxID=2024526 RepID=A0ABY4HJA4_9FLAO|nr:MULTISPECIES: tRNA (5-methylaminomethyl-2-thiouridine)(34)-methyltransferase MnmD [Flavobacterium]UOX32921.1 tRNA (5-methylaminomethyl-2-thiouridine)(34)-methyltransferase MnmD [Flavobacterium sediminilitoris]
MKREIIITKDGSTTIHLPDWNETYHSKFGAIQEAEHVFIKNGLDLFKESNISILEIGFGTGLNAFITLLEAEKRKQIINYVGVEAYPVLNEEIKSLNYSKELKVEEKQELFIKLHETEWEKENLITKNFLLKKRKQFFDKIDDVDTFDLIYFDAFGFRVQPELWSEEIFDKMYKALKKGGVLVTYACRSSIKNAMLSVGFTIEKLPGAPGKREMLRAKK